MKFCYRCGKCVNVVQGITDKMFSAILTIEQHSESFDSKNEYVMCKDCIEKIERALRSRD